MKNKIISFSALFLCAIFFCIESANAQNEDSNKLLSSSRTPEWSLEETALNILLKSPGFQADIYTLNSIWDDLKISSNLPDPELGGEYMVTPEDVDNRWAAEISWGIEWPGVYGAKSREAKSRMNVADKTIYAQRIEKIAEIKDLLLDYILCRQKIVLLDELDKNNKKIYELSEAQARSEEMTILDLNKVKIEYSNIKGARANILNEEAEIISALSEIYGANCRDILMNMDCSFPDINIPRDIDINQIRDHSPIYQTAVAEAVTAREGKKVSKMEAFPSLSLGYKHQFEDGMHFNGATIGISIPIFSSKGKRKAADSKILEADYKVETTAVTIETEINSLIERLKILQFQIEEISPYVENVDYNSILIKAFDQGLISLLDYISERNYFTNAAVEFITLRHAAAKTRNGLNKYLQTYDF